VQTLALLRDVCSALDAAHGRQLLHRDLKPENIVVTRAAERESAKVLDFGIAKFFSGEAELLTGDTAPGVLVGTRGYMSPEQVRGSLAGPAWDLWALAVTMYEVLVGVHPFEGRPQFHGEERAATAFTPVAACMPDASPGWQLFFEKALSMDPRARPQSAAAFLAAAEASIDSSCP
jgi:serine/threonine-protein kinase